MREITDLRLVPISTEFSNTGGRHDVLMHPAGEIGSLFDQLFQPLPGWSEEDWGSNQWRWYSGERYIDLGFIVFEGSWYGSPLTLGCQLEDVVALLELLRQHLPVVSLRDADGDLLSGYTFLAKYRFSE